jgi:hypothetical protein
MKSEKGGITAAGPPPILTGFPIKLNIEHLNKKSFLDKL